MSKRLSPVQIVGSVFRLRRDLARLLKEKVMANSDLTLEEADLLMDLYGASELNWKDPCADSDGFVSFAALKKSLVHSSAALSRRISELREAGFLETRQLHEGKTNHRRTDRKAGSARITKAGIEKIIPIYQAHRSFCESLLKALSVEEQTKLYNLNEKLLKTAKGGIWP